MGGAWGVLCVPLGKLIPYYFERFHRVGEGLSISFGEYLEHRLLIQNEADLWVFSNLSPSVFQKWGTKLYSFCRTRPFQARQACVRQ